MFLRRNLRRHEHLNVCVGVSLQLYRQTASCWQRLHATVSSFFAPAPPPILSKMTAAKPGQISMESEPTDAEQQFLVF